MPGAYRKDLIANLYPPTFGRSFHCSFLVAKLKSIPTYLSASNWEMPLTLGAEIIRHHSLPLKSS